MVHPSLPKEKLNNFGWFFPKETTTEWLNNYVVLSFNSVYMFIIQWECKTDMDSRYRFGEIAVNCEGYSYPDDPYVLKGSCGVCNSFY